MDGATAYYVHTKSCCRLADIRRVLIRCLICACARLKYRILISDSPASKYATIKFTYAHIEHLIKRLVDDIYYYILCLHRDVQHGLFSHGVQNNMIYFLTSLGQINVITLSDINKKFQNYHYFIFSGEITSY